VPLENRHSIGGSGVGIGTGEPPVAAVGTGGAGRGTAGGAGAAGRAGLGVSPRAAIGGGTTVGATAGGVPAGIVLSDAAAEVGERDDAVSRVGVCQLAAVGVARTLVSRVSCDDSELAVGPHAPITDTHATTTGTANRGHHTYGTCLHSKQ
jgi:hypothetical protein